MITEAEFVAIRSFDRQLAENTNTAQVIINEKNRRLHRLVGEVARLEAALAAETGKRRMAELQLAQIRRG